MVVGINMGKENDERLVKEIGCEVGSWSMSYLFSLPLGGNPCHASFWEPTIQRVAKRLDGWKRNSLSRVGGGD